MIVIYFFKRLLEEKNDKVKLKIIPKADEEYMSVGKVCIRFIETYRFLSSSVDSLVKAFVDNSHKTLKAFDEKIVDNDEKLVFVNQLKK